MKLIIKFFWSIVSLILFIALVAIAMLNMTPVDLDYFMGTTHLPLAFIVIIAFLIGVIMGALVVGSLGVESESRLLR